MSEIFDKGSQGVLEEDLNNSRSKAQESSPVKQMSRQSREEIDAHEFISDLIGRVSSKSSNVY